ncbi:MAG: hypothetical protein EXS05_11990 [Planctomycetaceae bacterium]|nr:hypothetical protein [Planctomycetaceae bacterium]
MDPRKMFSDERHDAFCVFCGAEPNTREHVASRILLDDPLPDDVPVVFSCHACNNSFSQDEEYLACFIDCVISGTTDPAIVQRTKVRASLRHTPALATKIASARREDETGAIVWKPEDNRVRNVVVKLARGHAAHQYSEPHLQEPERVLIVPLIVMSPEQREAFEHIPESPGWPEIGTRAFLNTFVTGKKSYSAEGGWEVLQRGRYRYAVAQPGEIVVRIVLSEFLGCEVTW